MAPLWKFHLLGIKRRKRLLGDMQWLFIFLKSKFIWNEGNHWRKKLLADWGKLYDLKSSLLEFEIWLFSFSCFLTPFGFYLWSDERSHSPNQKEWKPENVIVWIILERRLFIHVFQPFCAHSIVYNCIEGCTNKSVVNALAIQRWEVVVKITSKLHVFMRVSFFPSLFRPKKKKKKT